MISRRTVPVFAAGVLFMTVSAFGQPAIPVSAVPLQSSQFPPIGLASSETAQVNVVNTAAAPSSSPAGNTTPPSCTGTITFYNSTGSTIGAATSFTVGAGQIFSATLPYASIGASGSREVIRVAVALSLVTVASLQPPALCTLASSLETYDTATGVTHTFVAGATGQGLFGVIRGTPLVVPAP
jgi:hypothetical protein